MFAERGVQAGCQHCRRQSVEADIDAHGQAVDPEDLGHEDADQRERQVAVGDGAAELACRGARGYDWRTELPCRWIGPVPCLRERGRQQVTG